MRCDEDSPATADARVQFPLCVIPFRRPSVASAFWASYLSFLWPSLFQSEICAANGQRAGATRTQRPVLARRARHTSCRSAKDNVRQDGLACKGSRALPWAHLNSCTTFRNAIRARCNRCRCDIVIAHFPHAARPRQTTPTFALAFARLVAAPTAALRATASPFVGAIAASNSRCNAGNRTLALSTSWQPRKIGACRCGCMRNALAPPNGAAASGMP